MDNAIFVMASIQAPFFVSLKWPAANVIEEYGSLIDHINSLNTNKTPKIGLI